MCLTLHRKWVATSGLYMVRARCMSIFLCMQQARQAVLVSVFHACANGTSPSSTAGMARYRANGLSAEPPAKMMACTLLLMSSTVMTPTLLVVLDNPLHSWAKGILVPMLLEVDQTVTFDA